MPTVRFPRIHLGAVSFDDAAIAPHIVYDTVEATQEPHETTAQMIRRVTREREQAALETQQAEQFSRPRRTVPADDRDNFVAQQSPGNGDNSPYTFSWAFQDPNTFINHVWYAPQAAPPPTGIYAQQHFVESLQLYPTAPPIRRRAPIQCDYEPDVLPLPG